MDAIMDGTKDRKPQYWVKRGRLYYVSPLSIVSPGTPLHRAISHEPCGMFRVFGSYIYSCNARFGAMFDLRSAERIAHEVGGGVELI